MKLFCPIRGELDINDKANDGITFTEEKRRIDLVRFLLDKHYPKNMFSFEQNVWDIGNSGRNHLRADLVLNSIGGGIYLIAETKRDNKDKTNAVEQQLNPACIKTQCEYGIYYDGVENVFFRREDEYRCEYSLLKFPVYGFHFNDKPLTYNELVPVDNIQGIIDKLEQLLHNIGSTKEFRYRELFKIIQTKYFDEKQNKGTNNILGFQISINTAKNIKCLYSKAAKYYKTNKENDIMLDDTTIEKIVSLLQSYSFIKSTQDILQTLFMRFAQSTLKIELAQFYTPIDITNFLVSLLKIENTSKIIDPAGGSGDFLISCLKKNINCAENIYYWDRDPNACEVAKLNMILNGDGKTNIKQQDTIQNFEDMNNEFDFVITNPPFGEKTIFEGKSSILNNYFLYSECERQYKQLGVLYIERCLNLLKNGGILSIIVPNGFMTNPNDRYLRKWLLLNYKIIAYISLPEGAFKTSNTGVKTGILIIKKEKPVNNYKIFTDVAINIGFDYTSKKANKIYCKNPIDGSYILDKYNNKIVLTDLKKIKNNFEQFISDLQISGFESCVNNNVYNYIMYKDIINSQNNIIRAETNTDEYKNTVKKILSDNYSTLCDASANNEKNIDINDKKSINIIKKNQYFYIDISNLQNGGYLLNNKMYGWELPDRAKQSVKKYDICISRLKGSLDKFCMILNDNTENIVLTNGCYRIRIKDDLLRVSFYRFLFSKEYEIQMRSLATGSIMLDVKEDDLKNKLYFPIISQSEFYDMQNFIKEQEFIIKLRESL